MTEIDLYTGGSGGLARRGGADAGGALSVDDLTFTGKARSPHEVPTAFFDDSVRGEQLPPALQAMASGVTTLSKAVRGFGGDDLYQACEFWHAYPSMLVLTRAMRPLERVERRLRPVPGEPWRIAEQIIRPVIAGPLQRAQINDDTLTDTRRGDTGTNTGPTTQLPSDHEAGAFAQACLPSKVRMWCNREVSAPTRWTGALLRWSDDTETIDLLRADENVAVVVKARRALGAGLWELERRRFELREPRRYGSVPRRKDTSRGLSGGSRLAIGRG